MPLVFSFLPWQENKGGIQGKDYNQIRAYPARYAGESIQLGRAYDS